MQSRHHNQARYFEEQAASCREFYLPFLAARTDLKFGADCRVLEVGCGLGGILSAFAELGCAVTGVDISRRAIDSARELAAAAAASRATQHFSYISSCESSAGGGGIAHPEKEHSQGFSEALDDCDSGSGGSGSGSGGAAGVLDGGDKQVCGGSVLRSFVPSGGSRFVCADALDFDPRGELFDLIILHDCIEHIGDFGDKARLLRHLRPMLSATGVLYVAFPPWQMPFGGHQQMSSRRFLAHLPWVHLLPRRLFALVFRAFGHSASDIRSFLDIRDARLTVEGFERLASATSYAVVSRQLYLVNPNYSTKFGLRPRRLPDFLAKIPHLRNFLATTCYYILRACWTNDCR